ncbi:MAG: hypothetical protein JSV04_11185 [Candidatus Heimdallarchaeota archaeon]|nr:MAG: hypothetical protein JSV04_11185 [Candidatus Heimdallarchaeota archaeon]
MDGKKMTRSWISSKVSKLTYHECLFLVTSLDSTINYCLTLKHWNEPCPPRCAYYKAGSPGNLEELETRHYLLNCRKFSRKLTTPRKAVAYCGLYLMREPDCRQCRYPHKFQSAIKA